MNEGEYPNIYEEMGMNPSMVAQADQLESYYKDQLEVCLKRLVASKAENKMLPPALIFKMTYEEWKSAGASEDVVVSYIFLLTMALKRIMELEEALGAQD